MKPKHGMVPTHFQNEYDNVWKCKGRTPMTLWEIPDLRVMHSVTTLSLSLQPRFRQKEKGNKLVSK
jgi:hypothetical protein